MDNNRRDFIKKSGLGLAAASIGTLGMSAASYGKVIGANDRVRAAILGCSRRFPALMKGIASTAGAELAYVCDVNAKKQANAVSEAEKHCGYRPRAEKDLRKIAEDPNVDAIFVALPDHWHAHASWIAMENGKHVYVEKPCSHNPRESEYLVRWKNKYSKIVQMGNQQRSSVESREIINAIHDGVIGEVYNATAFYSNNRNRLSHPKEIPVPEWLDWELFQGPAPRHPFWDIIHDYDWHWYWHWGTAETGNNATHELDIARWAIQGDYPEKVMVNAGKYHFPDDAWTTYDTMDATFIFPGNKTIKWDGKSRNAYATYGAGRGTIIYGTEGTVFINRDGYKHYDRSGNLVDEASNEGSESGTALGGGGNLSTRHVANFIETIRGNEKLNSPIEEGAKSTQLCHYANISFRENNKALSLDPITGYFEDETMMDKYWGRYYEPGWELKA